jgi:hypothetical protein
MSKLFDLETIRNREPGPDAPVGKYSPMDELRHGVLPMTPFGSLRYAHVRRVVFGENVEIVPSPTSAVDPTNAEVVEAGEIIVVDTDFTPPKVVNTVGQFAVVEEGGLEFIPSTAPLMPRP